MRTLTVRHLVGPVLRPGVPDPGFRLDAGLLALVAALLLWAVLALIVLVVAQL